jgi:hypothetical protein
MPPRKTTVTVKLDQRAINTMLRASTGDVSRMMNRFARLAQQTTREVAEQRITSRTGKYVRSIKSRMTDPTSVVVEATVPYAMVIEKGSRPHPIIAKPGGVLAFEAGGRTVFARRVMHPGTQPRNVVRDGVLEAGRRIRTG